MSEAAGPLDLDSTALERGLLAEPSPGGENPKVKELEADLDFISTGRKGRLRA
ncbi:hypothetical protein [Thermus sp.]|uniref:hypothetical protein n=1 Tax=Thermus sp. TaxID=275 RepID=UPI0025ED0A85|nr:hypothetical protein [Thermus sp.]MCS6867801.1 hypothetical protein [Thermus sp.]